VSYTDVQPTDWFARTVAKAARMGGMRGDLDSQGRPRFRPADPITRAEAATIYVRATKPHRYALLDVRSAVVGISSPLGIGTGGFVREDGVILTNLHVAGSAANRFRVCLCDRDYPPGQDRWLINERTPTGELVDGAYAEFHAGGDGYHDLALIKLSPRQLAEAKQRLGDPLPLLRFLKGVPDPAEPVFSFGAPMGRYGWFAAGWVAKTSDANGMIECLGLDKAVNPGNSGGGVFTLERLVAGIITWKVVGTHVDSMGLAQLGNTEVIPWLRAHGVEPILFDDIPDEDEQLPLA
jgi:S1-C subfamily serine protease